MAGASRGLGLEFARQLATAGHDVVATTRADGYDVREEAPWAAIEGPVDGLIVNAGVQYRAASLAELDLDRVADVFDVNVFGPLRVVRALRPALEQGTRRVIAILSSRMGSFGEYDSSSMYAYRASKAALNMFTRCVADELAPAGFTTVALHPGWVRTDMGGPEASLGSEESVRGMLALLDRLEPAQNGLFLDWQGETIEW
ncbi:MAG: SDR family oxidoreductase [Planctomycetota bacterium]